MNFDMFEFLLLGDPYTVERLMDADPSLSPHDNLLPP